MSMKFVVPEAIDDTEDVQALIDTSISEVTTGSMVHILTQEVTVATQYVDFDGLMDYELYTRYIFLLDDIQGPTANLSFHFIDNTGIVRISNYDTYFQYGDTIGASVTDSNDTANPYCFVQGTGATPSGTVTVYPASSPCLSWDLTTAGDSRTTFTRGNSSCINDTYTLGGFRFSINNGSVDYTGGTFSMYGVLK